MKTLKGDPGGLLLSLLFGGAFGFSEAREPPRPSGMRTSTRKSYRWSGPLSGGEDILRLTSSGGLKVLLKGRLVVADGSAEGIAGAESSLKVGEEGG